MLYPVELRAPAVLVLANNLVKLERVVGVEGFEPPTSCSQSRCATRLRHTPNDQGRGGPTQSFK